MALDLTPTQVMALEARTEGWPAGLRLAAQALRTQADRDRFIQSFSGGDRLVRDYFAQEVLQA